MEVTQPLRVGLALVVGLKPPIQSPSVYDNETQAFTQQSMIPRVSWVFCQWEFHLLLKNTAWEVSQWEYARYRGFK